MRATLFTTTTTMSYLPSIKELYSEGLQNQVVDKACVKEDGELFVPDTPFCNSGQEQHLRGGEGGRVGEWCGC